MKVKAFLAAAAAGLALASSTFAANITYVLSLNDPGTGNALAGRYAVYAYTSSGDNSGLASYTITVTGQTTTSFRAPIATFKDSVGTTDPDTGDTTFGPDKSSGFTTLQAVGSTGVASTGSFDTVSGNGIAKYGVGQTAGNVSSVTPPAGYTLNTTVAQGAYGVTNSFTVANAGGTQTATGGQVPVLLVSGTYTGAVPNISLGAGNTFTGSGLNTSAATVSTVTRDLSAVPEPTSIAAIGLVGAGLISRRRKAVTA